MILRNAIPAALIWLTLALPCCTAGAGTNSSPAIPDRYLLIMDTSSPMRSRARAVEESIAALLNSGFQGEIRAGDQLGVWTFNNDLHTGEFELVIWDESARQEINHKLKEFLDKQRFSKSTDFNKVMPHLLDVVAASRRITVILVSDGDEAIQGTPFDNAIAAYYRENAKAIKRDHVPIITVLRGYKGRLIGHSVSYPPWPIEFPAFPPEPKPEPKPEPQPEPEPKPERTPVRPNGASSPKDLSRTLVTTNKGPIVYAQPLIVSGSSRTNRPVPSGQSGTSELAEGANTVVDALARPTVAPSTTQVADRSPEPAQDPESPGTDGENRSLSWGYLVIPAVAAVAFVVVFMGVMRMRRSRARRHASLITRSMDRRGGPE